MAIGNVVEDFYIGKCHVRICDDYCRNKSREEVDAILRRIADITIGPLIAAEQGHYDNIRSKNGEA